MSRIEIYSGTVMQWKDLTSLCEVSVYFYSTGEHVKFTIPNQITGTIICCDMFPNIVGTTRNFYLHKCKKIT